MDLQPILRKFFGKDIEPESVVTLRGDASTRKYHRVFMPKGVEPKTLIVMELPEDINKSDEITDGNEPKELPFLNMDRHLAKKGLRVPTIYLDAVDDRVLLLEDFGDGLLAKKVGGADLDVMKAWYKAAAELLADIHRAMWPIPRDCVAGTRSFDFELLRWELDHYREWGLEALNGKPLEPSVRKRLDAAFDALAREIASVPQGFVHRDYQSRNLMVLYDRPDPRSLAVIDFQDALKGPRVYDLVALLNDSYIDVPSALKKEIVRHYAGKMGIDSDELLQEFYLVAVQRKLKDGGRFVFIDRVRKNPSFLPYVEGSFRRVRAGLEEIKGHEALKNALAEADPGNFSAR